MKKKELIKRASEMLGGVDEKKLESSWSSWIQPSVGLIPPADARISTQNGMYGEYSDKHLYRFVVGYKLAARDNRETIGVSSPDAQERGRLAYESIEREAIKCYPEMSKEQAVTTFLQKQPDRYEFYLKEMSSNKWKYEARPGIIAKVINLLEEHTVVEVMANEGLNGDPLIELKMPVAVWKKFVMIVAKTVAEFETGTPYNGTGMEDDDIICSTDPIDNPQPDWRLRQSKIFGENN